MSLVPSKTRWSVVVGLGVTATASMSIGVTSDGLRGFVFGIAVPVVCIFVIGFLTDMLVGMLAGLAAGVVGITLASRLGGNLGDSPDAVINLMPVFAVLFLLIAAAVGMLCRLLSDYLTELRLTRRQSTH